jgi:two-component system response regulator MprA
MISGASSERSSSSLIGCKNSKEIPTVISNVHDEHEFAGDVMKSSILVVDDDPNILSMLKRALNYEGYQVYTAENGVDALQIIEKNLLDLVILDILMPKKNGWEVCQEIRIVNPKLPIIMLTAKDEVENRVKGLDLGADDYVVKPFILDELLARVRAHIRRVRLDKEEKNILTYEDLTVNLETRKAWRGKRVLNLKGKEFELLSLFLLHPHHVLSKDQILEQVWGYDYDMESNVLEVYIASLRQKLEEHGEPRVIHTVRGIGYVLRSE